MSESTQELKWRITATDEASQIVNRFSQNARKANEEAEHGIKAQLEGLSKYTGRGSVPFEIGHLLGGAGAVAGVALLTREISETVAKVGELNEKWRTGEVTTEQYQRHIFETIPVVGGLVASFNEASEAITHEEEHLKRAHEEAVQLGEEIKAHTIYLRESAESAKEFAEQMEGVQNQIKNVGLEGIGGTFAGSANRGDIAKALAQSGAKAASAIQGGDDPEKYIKAAPAELAKSLSDSAEKFNKELEAPLKRWLELKRLFNRGVATKADASEMEDVNSTIDQKTKDRQEDQLRIAREFAEKNRQQGLLADAEQKDLRRKANLEYNQEYQAGKIRLGDTQQEAQETALRSAERYYQADIAAMRHALQDKQQAYSEEWRKSEKNLSDQLDSGAITQAQYTEREDALNRQFENQGAADTASEAAKEAALNRSTLEGQATGRLDSLAGAGNRAARLAGESFQIKKRTQEQRDALNAVLANGNSTHADQDNALKLMRGLDDQQERELRHSAMRDVTYTPFAATSNIHSAGEARNLALQAGANAINFNRQHDDGKISDLAAILQQMLNLMQNRTGAQTEELLEH